MHRSGTSTITRAFNLLGASLGDEGLMPPSPQDNPEGFWERLDVVDFHTRLMAKLGRPWATAAPLPERWYESEEFSEFRNELRELINRNFANKNLWAWKDPRTCLLFPIWRSVLDELRVQLNCVFVVRGPLEVARSLDKRDNISLNRALGIWFNHYLTALRESAGLPCAFINYDHFLDSWETELRKCAEQLKISWPIEDSFSAAMNCFVKPDLRHYRATNADLENAPRQVRELYELLIQACADHAGRDKQFEARVNELYFEFADYASFFVGLDSTIGKEDFGEGPPPPPPPPKPPYVQRTFQRWRRSFQKRFGPSSALQ
jgi:hypothetical protein